MNSLRRNTEPLSSQRVAFPRLAGTSALLPQLGADRASNVITFKIEFRPSGFDRPVTEHFKDQILSKLTGAGIDTLTVVIKRGHRRELLLCFDGADEEVEKAKAAMLSDRTASGQAGEGILAPWRLL